MRAWRALHDAAKFFYKNLALYFYYENESGGGGGVGFQARAPEKSPTTLFTIIYCHMLQRV